MAPTDRIRESWDYLNRRQDQWDFALRRTETPALPVGSDAGCDPETAPEHRGEPPSADEQLAAFSRQLIIILETAPFLPPQVVQAWVGRIKNIDINRPAKGLAILRTLFESYDTFAQYEPRPNIFDLAIDRSMRYLDDMRDIKRELNKLEALLRHVDRLLKPSPRYRGPIEAWLTDPHAPWPGLPNRFRR
jgi:hypothetical protein